MTKNIFLEKLNIHPSWDEFVTKQIPILNKITNQVLAAVENSETKITPALPKVLRFLELPLFQAKVIILGQDPYPEEGVATGRAFEVGNLQSWLIPFKQGSLKNMLRLIYQVYFDEVVSFKQLQAVLKEKTGLISPPGEIFKNWEQQGVILLNTGFTFGLGFKKSHLAFWKPFTKNLLTFINEHNENLNWFLWGNKAKEICKHLTLKNKFESNHPSPLAQRKDDNFFQFTGFYETKNDINWLGAF